MALSDRRIGFRTALGLTMLAAALVLSGCGRKGGLEPPPGAAIKKSDDGTATPDTGIAKPNRHFVLDPLI